ncbi:MAG: acyl-CoA ligase (AMP-forming), exosortase A system-associated [Patescibacteria group bacterium]
MIILVHDLIASAAERWGERVALRYQNQELTYRALADAVAASASGYRALGLARGDRVAVYTEKRLETVIALFGATHAGGVMVPVNPVLKANQVAHIVRDSTARILVTTSERVASLSAVLDTCPSLTHVICIGEAPIDHSARFSWVGWSSLLEQVPCEGHRTIDSDIAALLYTSGSTGRPKGVIIPHRVLCAGAASVATYLELTAKERVLAVLPLSFDYGLNQLTATWYAGGCVVLMNHLLVKDIISMVEKEKITGLAAVPALWIQLAQLSWPPACRAHLRYITNSGGHMPNETLARLRAALPTTTPYLMYGLTESFRSTYLPPADLDTRPDSIGKAIPNAEVLVVRPDGTPCAPHEPGELVHRGTLVALGYWNDPEKTKERFRPLPGQRPELPLAELCVWSGDTVTMDEDGYLYYVGRTDEMIKTSGYRVSPTEIEEVLYATKLVGEVAVFGVPHPELGQAIAVVATPALGTDLSPETLLTVCRQRFPRYMVPAHLEVVHGPLPVNANGKFDRRLLAEERKHVCITS